MKTKTPQPTPTIAELWDKLKAALDIIELDDPNGVDTTMGGKFGTPPGEHAKMAAKMIPSLRQQLLERCEEPLQTFNGKITIRLLLDGACINIRPFAICTPSDLAEIEAMVGFVRLELEQRQREKEAQNGE